MTASGAHLAPAVGLNQPDGFTNFGHGSILRRPLCAGRDVRLHRPEARPCSFGPKISSVPGAQQPVSTSPMPATLGFRCSSVAMCSPALPRRGDATHGRPQRQRTSLNPILVPIFCMKPSWMLPNVSFSQNSDFALHLSFRFLTSSITSPIELRRRPSLRSPPRPVDGGRCPYCAATAKSYGPSIWISSTHSVATHSSPCGAFPG